MLLEVVMEEYERPVGTTLLSVTSCDDEDPAATESLTINHIIPPLNRLH